MLIFHGIGLRGLRKCWRFFGLAGNKMKTCWFFMGERSLDEKMLTCHVAWGSGYANFVFSWSQRLKKCWLVVTTILVGKSWCSRIFSWGPPWSSLQCNRFQNWCYKCIHKKTYYHDHKFFVELRVVNQRPDNSCHIIIICFFVLVFSGICKFKIWCHNVIYKNITVFVSSTDVRTISAAYYCTYFGNIILLHLYIFNLISQIYQHMHVPHHNKSFFVFCVFNQCPDKLAGIFW